MTTVLENETENVLEVHMESDTCPQCGQPIPAGTLEAHLPDCPGKIIIQESKKRVPTRFPKFPEPDFDYSYVSPWSTTRNYVPKRTTKGPDRCKRTSTTKSRSSGAYSMGSNRRSRMC